jgi:hypothetical protein
MLLKPVFIIAIVAVAMFGICLISIPSIDASSQGTMTIKSSQKNVEINKPITFSGKVIDSDLNPRTHSTIIIWEKDQDTNRHVAFAKTNSNGEYTVTVNAQYWDGKGQPVEIYAFSQSGSITSSTITIYIDEPKPYSTKTDLEKNYYSTEDTNLILKTEIDKKTKNILLFPLLTSSTGKELDAQTLYLNVDETLIGTAPSNQWVDLGSYKSGSHTIVVKYHGSLMGSIKYQGSSEKIYFENTDSKNYQSTNYNILENIKTTSNDNQYKDSTYNLKSKYYDLLQELESGIKLSKNTLSGLSFENHDAQKKIEFAWDMQYWALTYVDEGKNILKQTEVYLKNDDYQKASTKLHQFDKQTNFVNTEMDIIITTIKEGKELEESFQEKNKSCFLFWCSGLDTTKGLDNKIIKLELKTEKIKNKQKDIANDYQNIVYEQKLTKQKDDSKKEQEVLKKEQKAELKQQKILAEQEQKRLEDQKEKELKAQKLLAEQEQQRLEQEQRQIELRAKQEQQRLEQEQRQIELDYQRELEQKQKIQREKNKIILHAQNMPLVKGWMNGELTFYVEKLPSYVSQDVQNKIESLASQIDGNYINGVKMKRVYSWGDINVNWTKEYKEDAIGQMFGDDLFVGLGKSSCGVDWKPFDGTSVKRIMYHEIGHAMGQSHNSDFNNVMYATTDTRFEYDYDERKVLSDGYLQQIFFCNTGKISFSTEVINKSGAGYKVYVLGNNGSPEDVIQQKGAFYPDCSGYESEYYSFGRSCNVENGSSLVIYNPSRFNTGDDLVVNVKIIDINPLKDVNYTFEYDSRYGGLTQDYENRIKQLFG